MMPQFFLFALLCVLCGESLPAAIPGAGGWRHEELRRFKAAEANQGVAVDAEFFYVIDNHAIGKYRKDSGARVGGWDGGKAGRIQHLNAGVVIADRLYCAHSNFPKLPAESSVEIWDTATMQPVGQHRFERPPGSLTWAVPRGGEWFACFAHYRPLSDPARALVVRFDAQWQRLANWSFPADLIQRFAGSSASGGGFGPGGALFVTGHDARELYVLAVPETGAVLNWTGTIPISAEGQAFAWDPVETNLLYSISRPRREVIVSRISRGAATTPAVAKPAAAAHAVTPAATPAALSAEEKRLGFESLADGRSFTGWEHKGNWVVADGAFHRKDKGGDLTYTARKIPDDFELRFEWKVSKGCNSGVYYRPGQYEYQVLDNVNSPYGENPRQAAASLFFCMAPSRDATRPLGEWNEGRIVAKGPVIQHWLNGEAVIDFDYTDPRWAKEIDLLRIRGANLAACGAFLRLQDHGADVWFRHLRLRTIPADEKLARFPFTPMPIPAEALKKEQARVEQMLKAKEKK
ncbi:hypothetical protein LBMAG56_25790 [Verrucomicrobiota bacterium]|nr:hypothetical protein LBMAG56_25790 [Verrucomicrobiota bacterium]